MPKIAQVQVVFYLSLHQKRFNVYIQVPVQHTLHVGTLHARPNVFYELVRVQHIVPYLRAKVYALFGALYPVPLLIPLLHLYLVKPRPQHAQGVLFVHELRAFDLALDDNARGRML